MNNDNKFENHVKEFKKDIWITKGSRFNAARRLNNKSQLSIASISVLSIYGIAISLIPAILEFNQCKNLNNLYLIVAIILSVFILMISLLEGANNYQIKADRLHSNAKQLSELYKKIEYLENCNPEKLRNELENIEKDYNTIINQCPENHDKDDDLLFRSENLTKLKEKSNKINSQSSSNLFQAFLIKNWLYFKNYWLYLFLIFVTPIIVVFLHFHFQC